MILFSKTKKLKMDTKTISCCFCGFDLLDEDETAVKYRNVYICNFNLSQFWIDRYNKIRCCHCDAIIGKQLIDNPSLMILWRVHVEQEDGDSDEDNDLSDIESKHAVLFLERFAQVRITESNFEFC